MSVTNRKVDILLNCKGYSCYYGLFVESKSGFEVFISLKYVYYHIQKRLLILIDLW